MLFKCCCFLKDPEIKHKKIILLVEIIAQMMEKNEIYRDILDNMYDGVYFVDEHRRITYWNSGAERISGYSASEVIGRSCAENLLMHVDAKGHRLCKRGCPLAKTLEDGKTREVSIYLHHSEGYRLPVLVRDTPIRDEKGQITGAVEVFSDNTTMIETLERVKTLSQQAFIDPLTGIGNRRYIENEIQDCLSGLKHHGVTCGILFIDLDHLKTINDTFGHDLGDEALKLAVKTIRDNMRATDAIGRWGGDEFIAFLRGVTADQLFHITDKIRSLVESSSLETPMGPLTLTVSIGATMVSVQDTPETLQKRVDNLLYGGKNAGRNVVVISE
jgi:diguanylate cyclase (GGDEF)-like protein/PAS domain S-box-containing protein